MGVSYRKLREILVERQIKKQTLHKAAKISTETLARINKDEYMDLQTLEKIARYLNVEIGDIVELK